MVKTHSQHCALLRFSPCARLEIESTVNILVRLFVTCFFWFVLFSDLTALFLTLHYISIELGFKNFLST